MQNRIEHKISALRQKTDREALLPTLKRADCNLLFRQASTKKETLEITEILYQHKDEIMLDVNAKRAS